MTQHIETKVLQNSDLDQLKALINLYRDVFKEEIKMPSDAYLQLLLERDGMTFLIAMLDGAVVGGLTAHDLPSTYFEANEVYVYDLAVATEHQRKGIGRQLLTALRDLCREKGESEFFLQADFDDDDAIEFYRAVHGLEEKVVHFSFDTK